MFPGDESACEHNLRILRIEESDFDKLSDVLSRRMALRTHNRFSRRFKNDFGNVDEGMFHVDERQ
jgi:hypothetical protein